MGLRISEQFRIACLDWAVAETAARELRAAVFVREQGIPEHLEWDGRDAECVHAVAFAPDGVAIGVARLMPDGRIGRMAVRQDWRGRGVGSALLHALLEQAALLGLRRVYLHSQIPSCGFYSRHGFVAQGPEYQEGDIPHRTMQLDLPESPPGDAG